MKIFTHPRLRGYWLLLIAIAFTAFVYLPGLTGTWIFDDYPNIVENNGVHVTHASIANLARAALSSPSSEFKRPLASLSFAFNYMLNGLDPYGWKLFNVLIHLLNGALVFVLARSLLKVARQGTKGFAANNDTADDAVRDSIVAAILAAAWMLLPINLTAVLYVVQRMESMANIFVLLGLIGYVSGRKRMLSPGGHARGLITSAASLCVFTALGVMAKETAVLLPLYAFLVEAILLRFRSAPTTVSDPNRGTPDRSILALFVVVLAIPLIVGLAWQIPHVLQPGAWASRNFTLRTRLLTEARIVSDYVAWTFIPLPHWLSFYHDNIQVSSGLLHPWTTLAGIIFLLSLAGLSWKLRKRKPLVSLGLALYLGCHTLTGTILPLELAYEHRNYFASFGLMLAFVPLMAVPRSRAFSLPRHTLLGGLVLLWAALSLMTAINWGNPLYLSQDLAYRAPNSPRAQYALGRTYIIYSHYDPDSPFTRLAYPVLEKAAKLPYASILPEQALIFLNARLHRPIKSEWWDSMIAKLRANRPGVQDQSSLASLTQCAREGSCMLSKSRMTEAFEAALSHPSPNANLRADYGDYAWNVLGNRELGLRMTEKASESAPSVPAFHITLARMYVVLGQYSQAEKQIRDLEHLNIGGRLSDNIAGLRGLIPTTPSTR